MTLDRPKSFASICDAVVILCDKDILNWTKQRPLTHHSMKQAVRLTKVSTMSRPASISRHYSFRDGRYLQRPRKPQRKPQSLQTSQQRPENYSRRRKYNRKRCPRPPARSVPPKNKRVHRSPVRQPILRSLNTAPTNDPCTTSALLQQSLNHFQSQETLPAQAHLARTPHWYSAIYEAQGSKIMGNAIKAAARQTSIGVREARGCAEDEGIASLSSGDFDGEGDFWCR